MAVQYVYEPFNNIQLDALGKHVFFGGLQVAGKAGGPDMAEMRRVAETMQVQVPAGATDAAMLAACRLWISGATGPALALHIARVASAEAKVGVYHTNWFLRCVLASEHFKGGAPTEHERLLLRRAASFAALGQFAEAVADYRSAAALNPFGSQLAQEGLREAWRALQLSQKRSSLYEVLEVAPDASAEELRKAYRRAALKWHPDRHANADAARQVEADAKFKELAAAWAVLGDEELRVAYDEDLARGGGGEW